MNYTSGTTGRPRGIRRPLPGKLPEETYLGGFLGIFGIRPFDGNVHLVCSPLYHTAVLQFAGAVPAHRAPAGPDGQVDAGGDARA